MSTFVPLSNDPEPEAIHAEYLIQKARQIARERLDVEREPEQDLDSLYLDRGQLDRLPQPAPLIPGVLNRHSYAVLRGRDGTLKTFAALDWACHLATGLMYNLTPVEQVPVLYVAGEGAYGLGARVTAWEQAHQATVAPEWLTVRQSALNMHRPGPAFDHLLAHVHERRYGLVVVDTLRRVSGSADGNSSEMGAVVDNLDRLKLATADGSVLVIAHTDKGDNDSRGYSGIEDDADIVWHAHRDGNRLELELTKFKDGADGTTINMQAWPVGGSLVLRPALVAARRDEANESEKSLLATLRYTFPDGTYSGALYEASGLAKATYHRALGSLKKRGDVVNSGSHKRPFYQAASLTGSAEVSPLNSPPDLQRSHLVSVESQEVSQVSRPLGSETHETNHRDNPPGEPSTVGSSAPGGLTPAQIAILASNEPEAPLSDTDDSGVAR